MAELIDPRVHDPQAIRSAAAPLLGLALLDARNTTLARLAAFDGLAQPSPSDEFDPPQWLAGHAAWFQERWILRNVQRNRAERCDPRAPRLASLEPRADDWFDPLASGRRRRWAADRPDADAVRGYMEATLDATLELLERTREDADALHFFRLALHHEDRIGEQFAVLAQALGVEAPRGEPPPVRARRDAIGLPAQRVLLGERVDAWRPAIEDGQAEERVAEFAIDAQPVTWAQWLEFVAEGGYDEPQWWGEDGWRWVGASARRAPRYVEQQSGGVTARRGSRLRKLPAGQATVHVSWYEARAWCRWAGRRLPAEAEWVSAQRSASARGFRWGEVLEWVGDRAQVWTAARAAPGEEGDLVSEGRRVLRGASWAGCPRLHHPGARRFALPGEDAQFCGFRSCAL